jgi:hypothetical protein
MAWNPLSDFEKDALWTWRPRHLGVAAWRSLGKQVCDYFREIKRTHHRAIQEDGTRKLFIPACARRVDGDFIPLNSCAGAAFRLRLTCVRLNLVSQFFCEQVVLIPVLLNSPVRQPRQDRRAGTGIVRWKNRFPHRIHTDMPICVLL